MSNRSRAGEIWQAQLDTNHARYLRDGSARIARTSGQAKNVGGKVVFTGKGLPDYVGCFRVGLEPVMFVADAKSTGDKKLYFNQLDEHQARDLEGFRDQGALTGILANIGSSQMHQWFIPWKYIREAYYAHEKVISTERAIPFSRGDWLTQVLHWLDGAELSELYLRTPDIELDEEE